MKRLLSALLTMLMLLALLPVIAEEAMPAEKEPAQVLGETWYGPYKIRMYDDQTCVILQILEKEKYSELDIPAMLGEYKVVGIGDSAASNNKYLTRVSIPDSVVYIGNEAFRNCEKLVEARIGDYVLLIGREAFYGCSQLKGIDMGERTLMIGDSAFSFCKALTTIILPENVMEIGTNAFNSCESLTGVVIPDSVEKLGYLAFAHCKSLRSVDVIGDVAFIGDKVFYRKDLSNLSVSVTENSLVHLYCDAWDYPYVLK